MNVFNKIYWLIYTFPRTFHEKYSDLGITYICFSDDDKLNYGHSVLYDVNCIDNIKRHAFKTFNSYEEMVLVSAVNNWDLHPGSVVFGKNIVNVRQLNEVSRNSFLQK